MRFKPLKAGLIDRALPLALPLAIAIAIAIAIAALLSAPDAAVATAEQAPGTFSLPVMAASTSSGRLQSYPNPGPGPAAIGSSSSS